MEQNIKLSGIIRNLPDNTVPDGTMHELINLRPRDGALRPVGPKVQTVIAARDVRHIHRVSNSIVVYIGSSQDGLTLSYWVSVSGVLGNEVLTDIIIPTNGEQITFANLKNAVMVSCQGEETLWLLIFDENTNTYSVFDNTTGFLPIDIPDFVVQRVEVSKDSENAVFDAPYTVNLNDALMAEYVKMQRAKEDKGYLSGKVLIRFAWELFDGTLVKHTVPDLTRTSELSVTYALDGTLFNNEGGWEVSTAFTAYKLQFYFAANSVWLAAFQSKYQNIIRSLKIYISQPKSPEMEYERFDFGDTNKITYAPTKKVVERLERKFDVSEITDYSPDPETEQYYLLREIKISDLTASTWTDIIDTTDEDISVQNLSTREQMTVDNFTHHQLFANRLFTYNERIFLADIKNTLLQGFPIIGLLTSTSTPVPGPDYEVALEYEVTIEGNKSIRVLSAWQTLAWYSNITMLSFKFSFRWHFFPGQQLLGEYGYIGYPDGRAKTLRVLVRYNDTIYLARTVTLTSYQGQNYAITKGFEVDTPIFGMTVYSPTNEWSYYDTNRVQATELNNPFYFPAINSYRLGLGQVLGMATNAIALSQGQFGQFPVFVFCSDGIFAMNIGTGETLINTISPLSREVCSNPDSITPIDAGAAFTSARGLFVIAGTAKPELSEAAEGKHTSRITALAAYDTVCNDANYYQIRSLLCGTDFLSYLANAIIGYDYMHNEIIVSNETYPYSWVFSIDHKLWFKISESFKRFVNDYPLCYGIKDEEEVITTTEAPTTEPPTTTEPPLTTEAPTTTETPTTTVAPEDGGYGRLYNWYAATDVRNIANTGWSLPTNQNALTLREYLDPVNTGFNGTSINTAGGKMKELGTAYWTTPNTGATNSSFFNGKGAGRREPSVGTFEHTKSLLYLWNTYEDNNPLYGGLSYLVYNQQYYNAWLYTYTNKKYGFSIRLIKDSTTLSHGQQGTYTGNDGKIYRTICIGTQEWLADNLAETKYRDGSDIPIVTDNSAWAALTTGAMCSYNNDDNLI